MLPGMMPFTAPETAGGAFSVTVGGAADSATDASSYTFAGVNIGSASAARYVVVCVMAAHVNANPVNSHSVTVGGVSATQVIFDSDDAGTSLRNATASIHIVALASGATADIGVTLSHTVAHCAVQAYALYSLNQTTARDTAQHSNTTSGSLSAAIDCPADGVIIGAYASRDTGTPSGVTWSLATRDSNVNASGAGCFSAAHEIFATQQTGLTVTASETPTNGSVMVLASFL